MGCAVPHGAAPAHVHLRRFENQKAHNRIEGNVNRVEKTLKTDINKVDNNLTESVKVTNENFNRLFLELGKVIGKQDRSDG